MNVQFDDVFVRLPRQHNSKSRPALSLAARWFGAADTLIRAFPGTGSARAFDMVRSASLVMLFGASVVLATDEARAQPPPACPAWDIEYALVGTLRLTDTPFGKANGAHKVGPGKIVLRIEPASGRVKVLSYSMRQAFKIVVSAFFSTVNVVAETTTRASPDACGVAAEGVLKDGNVQWTSSVRAVRTDGTLTCEGKYCGKFGVPAPGTKPVSLGPSDMRVRPFEFSNDLRTFTMPYTLGAKTESPKQTSFLALTGREVKRTCVQPPPPCTR